MTTTHDPSVYFKSLKTAILKNQDKSVIEKTPELVTLSFSDLIYSITPSKYESISFKSLSLDFTIDSKGELTLMELEDGELKFYALGEGSMRDRLMEFVAWRAKVVATAGI